MKKDRKGEIKREKGKEKGKEKGTENGRNGGRKGRWEECNSLLSLNHSCFRYLGTIM